MGVCEGDPVKGWLLIKKKIMTPAPVQAPKFSGRAGKTLSPAPWPRPDLPLVSLSPPTLVAARSTSQSSKDEGTAVPGACRAVCPHGRSSVCCLLCAAQLNIANPSTGKQKLIEIEDEKKLCAALPWLLPCLQY